jgi:predicted Rossmann-fold nucleotide-binding protein
MDDGLEQLTNEIAVTDMVCITGGFFQDRTDPWFRKTAEVARLLSNNKKVVVTGGGPGIMEAANLGAYLSVYDASALDTALAILARAPKWTDPNWLDCSLEVKARFPKGGRSVGIPTWFYGFEPTNLFASDIAKYFDNNIREGILMSIAKGGAVFAPGSAGARQEIFMVATQNHFGSSGFFYPMVLFGTDHYQVETHVFQLLQEVANDNYKDLLYSTDDPADVVQFIRDHPPARSHATN